MTHPHPKRKFVPTTILTKSGQVPVNAVKQSSPKAATSISTVRPVNTASPKSKVNDALLKTYSYFKAHLLVRRAFNQKSAAKTNNLNEKVKTAKVNKVTTVGPKAVVSASKGNGENVVKSSACWIWRPTGNVIDHTSKDSGSYMLKRFGYVDLQGRLKSIIKRLMVDLLHLEEVLKEVLWIQNQMLDYGFNFMNTKIYIDNESTICIVKNPVFHSKTKHIEIRHHFIRDSYEKRLIQVIKINTVHNVADLLTKAFDVSSQDWMEGHVGDEAVHKELDDRMERAATTASSLEAEQDSGDEAASIGVDVRHGGAATTVTSLDAGQGSGNINKTPSMPYDSPLPRDRCKALEIDLRQTKKVYGDAFTRLVKKVTPTKVSAQRESHTQQDQHEDHLRVLSAAKVLADAAKNVHTYTRRRRAVSTGSDGVSTTSRLFNTAKESVSTAGASMPQRQKRAGYEAAVRLQEQLDEEERQRISRVREEASSFNIEEWEDIQSTIEADEELAQRIQAEEIEKYSKAEKARLLAKLINQRKRYFARQRAKERRNKPLTQAQQRTYMPNYIKHIGSHTLQQLKRLSFDELKALFETTMRRVQTFHPIESEGDKIVPELTIGSSKRDAEVELDHEGSKKQKTNEALGSVQEQP
ncbi:hypothetical protein Tco_0493176 [Tanacetum coccineum]